MTSTVELKSQIRVLLLEDRPADAELILFELRRFGFDPEWTRVEDKGQYLEALNESWDVILSDYSLPQFDGLTALRLLRERDLEIPFILVSGTIGEQKAVDAMKNGASDFVMKDRLGRLGPAVERELREAVDHRRRIGAEEALRTSESRLRAVSESANDAIVVADETGIIRFWNRAAEGMFGHPPERAIGSPLTMIVPEGMRPMHQGGFDRFMATGHSAVIGSTVELTGLRANGEVFPLELTLSTWVDKSGRQFSAIIRDITKRKAVKNALIASEKRYREFFEYDLSGNYIANVKGEILACNLVCAQIFDFDSVSEMMKSNISTFYPAPDDRVKFLTLLQSERQLMDHEWETRTRRGRNIVLVENVLGTFDDNDLLVGLRGYIIDITEKRRANDMMKASEQRFRKLIEYSSDMISIVDASGTITFESPAVERVLGHPPEEVVGKNILDFLHVEDRHEITSLTLSGLKKSNGVVKSELRFMHKDGSWRVLENISKTVTEDGHEWYAVINSRDVTMNRRNEQDLIVAKERAELSERLKNAFVANISHEIRTPLNVILGFNSIISDMLREKAFTEEHELFENVQVGAERLVRTVDMILDISRLEAGEFRPHPSVLDLCPLVKRSTDSLAVLATQRSLTLEFNALDANILVETDADSVTTILENLVENALKYTSEGGVVITVCRTENGKPCIEVKDTGIGISREYLPTIFSPFSQEQIGYSRAYEGVGLGLAIVKKLATLNGIAISVVSDKGIGTTFTLEFPHHRTIIQKKKMQMSDLK